MCVCVCGCGCGVECVGVGVVLYGCVCGVVRVCVLYVCGCCVCVCVCPGTGVRMWAVRVLVVQKIGAHVHQTDDVFRKLVSTANPDDDSWHRFMLQATNGNMPSF